MQSIIEALNIAARSGDPIGGDGSKGVVLGEDVETELTETLNLTPEGALLVFNLHRLQAAWADAVQTNTFCANQDYLERKGLGNFVELANAHGVAIARAAAEDMGVWVVGSIG